MPLSPSWQDIALRLLLALIASGMIGLNRQARGHAAGLRTTILIGLAAAVAMVLANFLLSTAGKTAELFTTMDVMRLPLGILTGVGFIGGGAIFRRGDLVTGVTTAATLWMVTVIGLCFGGGYDWLGVAATVLTLVTLFGLRIVDQIVAHEWRGILVIEAGVGDIAAVNEFIRPLGYRAIFKRQRADLGPERIWLEVRWTRSNFGPAPADLIERVRQRFVVVSFEMEGAR
jgi:putative Mg2+ transporter-C (MgtC) family protein